MADSNSTRQPENTPRTRRTSRPTGGNIATRARDTYIESHDRARDRIQGIEKRIIQRPLKSMLTAAGVGLILGIFWPRR